jgi:hypothetical protein
MPRASACPSCRPTVRGASLFQPFLRSSDMLLTALDAATIEDPGFIAEHARNADAGEYKVAGGPDEPSTRRLITR